MRLSSGTAPRAMLAAAWAAASLQIASAQPSGLSAGETMAWHVANDVVRVTTTLADGSAGEEGFGFVFGEASGSLYVVTANHVVRQGRSEGREAPDAANSVKVQVIFKDDQGHRYNAELLDLQLLPERGDVAVLELPKPRSFDADWPSVADADRLVPGVRAWRIGKVERWIPATAPGEFVGRSALWLAFDNLDTPRGSSGGPVVTEDGIVGMVVAEGGLTGVPTDVLPIGTIEGVLQGWQLPWNLPSAHASTAVVAPAPPEPRPSPMVAGAGDATGAAADAELALGMTETDRSEVQHRLNQLGFAAGDEDGQFGAQTRDAIKAYQTRSGLPVSGYVDALVQARLASDSARSASAPATSAVTSVPTMDEAGLRRFALRYFAMLPESGALDFLRQSSADNVRYYGKILNREQFLAQESSAFERWPERRFIVRSDTVQTSCDSQFSCKAWGTADFALRSVQRGASSSGSLRFYIGMAKGPSGGPVITALDSVEAPVGKTAAPAPLPAAQPSAPIASSQTDSKWTTKGPGDCATRYYLWHISKDFFEFTDQSGQTDIERIASRDGTTVVTETVASTHHDLPTASGTRWSYVFGADGRVKVHNMQQGNAFILTKCAP